MLTNFGVWLIGGLYPRAWAGLVDCFVAAIPFFRNTLMSDLLYSALLFGGLALAEKRWPFLPNPEIELYREGFPYRNARRSPAQSTAKMRE